MPVFLGGLVRRFADKAYLREADAEKLLVEKGALRSGERAARELLS